MEIVSSAITISINVRMSIYHTVYGFVNQTSNGSYIKQASIIAAEGTTLNLTIFYWKGILSSTNYRQFDLTTSGSVGTYRIIIMIGGESM